MSVLAIDYGARFIGLALQAKGLETIVPFGTIENTEELFERLKKMVDEEGVTQVIVGMPDFPTGKPSTQSAKTQEFVEQLQVAVSCPVHTISEALTSRAADEMDGDLYPQASIHEKSAMMILQDWKTEQ